MKIKLNTLTQTNRFLRIMGLIKIPLIFFCRPKVIEISDENCVVKIPYKRRVKNHVNSIYMGALTVGADITGALIAMRHIEKTGKKIVLIFKDAHADYFKLIKGDAYFTCNDGAKIQQAVHIAANSGERQNIPVEIMVTVPNKLGDTPAAKYTLTLSIKDKG